MPWLSKEHETLLHHQPIPGLFFLIGDLFAQSYKQDRLKDKKYPLISFPSGIEREIIVDHETGKQKVHIFQQLYLSILTSRDEAYREARETSEQRGYQLTRVGTEILEVWDIPTGDCYWITFDNTKPEMTDLIYLPREGKPKRAPRPMELLDAHTRALLSDLYENQHLGLEAIAIVKFFAPESLWTWYATEFDGEDTFFGLVSGFEVELGYFSLSELQIVRTPLGLTIERDIYFQSKSLRVLKQEHQSGR
jgi:hypothetical protein